MLLELMRGHIGEDPELVKVTDGAPLTTTIAFLDATDVDAGELRFVPFVVLSASKPGTIAVGKISAYRGEENNSSLFISS